MYTVPQISEIIEEAKTDARALKDPRMRQFGQDTAAAYRAGKSGRPFPDTLHTTSPEDIRFLHYLHQKGAGLKPARYWEEKTV